MTAFDLFRTTSQGTEWVGTFLKLDWAKSDAKMLAGQVPGDYFIVDQVSGDKVFELIAAVLGVHFHQSRSVTYENRTQGS